MKKYAVIIILLSLFINDDIYPQTKTIRVFFRDKGPDEFKKGSELYQTTINTLSERAISRRIKTLGADNFVSYEDAPVYPEYS